MNAVMLYSHMLLANMFPHFLLIADSPTKEALQFQSCQTVACGWKPSSTMSKHEWLLSFLDIASLKYATARLLGAKSINIDFWNSGYL